jgi:hypothetical protein
MRERDPQGIAGASKDADGDCKDQGLQGSDTYQYGDSSPLSATKAEGSPLFALTAKVVSMLLGFVLMSVLALWA